MIRCGLDVLAASPAPATRWGRCALLLNQASVDAELRPSQVVLQDVLGERLVQLFSPQHGLCADKQDNMVESAHSRDLVSGLPFYSLYSEVREPTDAMLENIDTVIVDIQDVGTRVYTFVYTMAGIMRVCARRGKHVVILDRPNPIDGVHVEGNILDDDARSFVGEYPLPMRHGMTVAEIAGWMNATAGIGASLEVIPMEGWDRGMSWHDTGRPWIMTSPNIPTADTCLLYPGMVLLEGTNLSEGRGTTMPFLTIGAPYLRDIARWMEDLTTLADTAGVILQPTIFEPTFHKWATQSCYGVRFIVRTPSVVQPYLLGLAAIIASSAQAPDTFRYNDPPYEYDYVRQPIHLLTGSASLPHTLITIARSPLSRRTMEDLAVTWKEGLDHFHRTRRKALLYSGR